MIAAAAERDAPAVVVLDEVPYLIEGDPSVEGALQTAWDRHLRDRPVLLIVIGSDLSMMSALMAYGRPLFGRPTRELVVEPLTPADVADALSLEPPARTILSIIGAGERTFTAIGQRSGITGTSLNRALDLLLSKRVVERMVPCSSRPSRLARDVVCDPYLRFWLRFLERGLELVQRGRGDLVESAIAEPWSSYRGKAVEPVCREAVRRLLPLEGLGDAARVGGYWTRSGELEVGLVGVGRVGPSAAVRFLGSVEWCDGQASA
ncbi:MAG: ATP-binding protein [Egibacteraceae bacterium]